MTDKLKEAIDVLKDYRKGDFVYRDECAEFFFQIRHGNGIRTGMSHGPDPYRLL